MTLQYTANRRTSRMARSVDVARYQRTSTYRQARARQRRRTALIYAGVVLAFIATFALTFMAGFDATQAYYGDPHGYLEAGHNSCHYWAGELCPQPPPETPAP